VRLRCPFCERRVRAYWLRCPVCETRLAAWYGLALTLALAAAAFVVFLLFREYRGG